MNAPQREASRVLASRVLVVEDDQRLLSVMKHVLDDAGYETATAVDGHVAIERLSRLDSPDVVVLDLQMAFVSGYEVLEWMKQNRMQIPVVLSTLDDEYQSPAPVVVKLSKPFNLEQLLDAVTLALSTSREHLE